MIINQDDGLVVPDKTIVFFPVIPEDGVESFDLKNVDLFLKPLNTNHKRQWFTSHFYHCLPLVIGNMQGFAFSMPYKIEIFWNGGLNPEDLQIKYFEDFDSFKGKNFIHPASEFGNGILTIHFPLQLKTPPGINLMTIAPPNFPLPGLSPMTGVIETDNLRFTFTLNIKVDFLNTRIIIEPDTPLIAIIPIPRYFCDSFKLKNAYDIFDKKIIKEELDVVAENAVKRSISNKQNLGQDRLYYLGKDVKGNKFPDHQLPKKNKN
jgi:hypothetical protein